MPPPAYEEALAAEFGMAHTFRIAFDVVCLGSNRCRQLGIVWRERPRFGDEFFDFAVVQQMLTGHYPAPLGGLVVGVKSAAEIPEMLPGVVEIYDLDGAGELFLAGIPDPLGAVAYGHFDLGPTPTTLMGFGVDTAENSAAGSMAPV